jgi:integrase
LTWCVVSKLVDTNPVQHFSKLNDTDPPRERRALSADEFSRLIESTLTAPNYRRLTGEDRAMLYLVAAYSGLRASELSSLTPESFDLDNGCIVVAAAHSKRRRIDRQPVRADLVELLRGWLPGRPGGKLWAGSWSNNAAEMIRDDLKAAGVAYVDDAGKVADFHALRHTYISSLAMANVPIKVAQVLARHSTVTLTMDIYSHSETRHETAALATLPAMPKWSQRNLTHERTHSQPPTRHYLALPGTTSDPRLLPESTAIQPPNGYFLHSTPVCYGSDKTRDGRFPTCLLFPVPIPNPILRPGESSGLRREA